jgi:hypothetical protein
MARTARQIRKDLLRIANSLEKTSATTKKRKKFIRSPNSRRDDFSYSPGSAEAKAIAKTKYDRVVKEVALKTFTALLASLDSGENGSYLFDGGVYDALGTGIPGKGGLSDVLDEVCRLLIKDGNYVARGTTITINEP